MFLNIPLLKTINNFENKDRHNPTSKCYAKIIIFYNYQYNYLLFFSNTEKHKGKTPNPVSISALVSIPFFSIYKLADKYYYTTNSSLATPLTFCICKQVL